MTRLRPLLPDLLPVLLAVGLTGILFGCTSDQSSSDTTWTRTATYESPARRDTPVTITKADNAERMDLPIRMQNGQFAAQMHAVSWGLHTPPGKGLVHVFAQESDAGLELTVERFTMGGTRHGTTVVDTASALNVTPLTLDGNGNLYLSDTREVPQLRRLSWNPVE